MAGNQSEFFKSNTALTWRKQVNDFIATNVDSPVLVNPTADLDQVSWLHLSVVLNDKNNFTCSLS